MVEAVAPFQQGPSVNSMRVVTQNLYGHAANWTERRSVLGQGLDHLHPDLMAFQEAIVTAEYDQVADLLGSSYHLVHQAARGADGSGISIASRWTVGDLREVDMHVTARTADFACTTLIAEIHAPQPFGPLLFVNHKPNWQPNFAYERELQAVVAARYIEHLVGTGSRHVVLAGDFDSDPDAANMRFWTGHQSLDGMSVCYRDAWVSVNAGMDGDTFTPHNPLVTDWDWPFHRIDYILVRCGEHGGPTLAISACARIFDAPVGDVWASDHFGVVADLAVVK